MLYIQELLPNPAGDESVGEWIRLINDGDTAVVVGGWQLADKAGKNYILTPVGSVAPGEVVEISREASGIALNNNGDEVYLIDDEGTQIDTLAYTSATEGEIITASRFMTEEAPTGNLNEIPPELARTTAPDFAEALTLALILALVIAGVGWRLASFLDDKQKGEPLNRE